MNIWLESEKTAPKYKVLCGTNLTVHLLDSLAIIYVYT